MRTYNWTKGSTPPHERILARVKTDDPDACWDWPGATGGRVGSHGIKYGYIMTGSRSDKSRRARLTHVVMYEHFVGPIPDGMELDHLCKRPICCNPQHLEAVTHQENAKRQAADHVDELRERLAHARAVLAATKEM